MIVAICQAKLRTLSISILTGVRKMMKFHCLNFSKFVLFIASWHFQLLQGRDFGMPSLSSWSDMFSQLHHGIVLDYPLALQNDGGYKAEGVINGPNG